MLHQIEPYERLSFECRVYWLTQKLKLPFYLRKELRYSFIRKMLSCNHREKRKKTDVPHGSGFQWLLFQWSHTVVWCTELKVRSTLHSKQCHINALRNSFHFIGHTIGFYAQTGKLEPPCTVSQTVPHESISQTLSFEWSHFRVSYTDEKARTTLNSVAISTT